MSVTVSRYPYWTATLTYHPLVTLKLTHSQRLMKALTVYPLGLVLRS